MARVRSGFNRQFHAVFLFRSFFLAIDLVDLALVVERAGGCDGAESVAAMVWKTLTLPKDLNYSELSRSNRVRLGMERARKRGVRLGRPRLSVNRKKLKKLAAHRSLREIAKEMGCSKSFVQRELAAG